MNAPEDDPRDELTEEEFWRGMEDADKLYPPDADDDDLSDDEGYESDRLSR